MGIFQLTGGSTGGGVVGTPSFISALAGGAISQGQAVTLDGAGNAFAAGRTDYAAVANGGASAVALASYCTSGVTVGNSRLPALLDTAGAIYTVGPSASANGLKVFKHSASGTLLLTATVSSSASPCVQPELCLLSNGNILVVFIDTAGGHTLRFIVLTPSLVTAVALTTVGTPQWSGSGGQNHHAKALIAGGFAIIFQSTAASLPLQLAIYTNTGSVTFAAATIQATLTNEATMRIAQLSNGNLLIAYNSVGAGPTGSCDFGVFSVTGSVVTAFAAITLSAPPGTLLSWIEISVMTGFAAIATTDNSQLEMVVVNNAGAVQGSQFANATFTAIVAPNYRVVNDGTQFYLVSCLGVVVATTSGAFTLTPGANVPVLVGASSTGFDAFCENGMIACVSYVEAGGTPTFFTFRCSDFSTVLTPQSIATQGGAGYPRIIPGGDATAILVIENSATPTMSRAVYKYADTCILGVASSSATAGGQVQIIVDAESYNTAFLAGSPSVAFDHTSSTLSGNKGVLMTYGLVLKGMS